MTSAHSGSCLCGSVSFVLSGDLAPVSCCHCTQCRKTTGHYLASTVSRADALTFSSDAGLKWYRSSDHAERGFCADCGSTLFWRANGSPDISIAVGSLSSPTGLKIARHIFVTDQGDYYPPPADAPCFATYPGGPGTPSEAD
ncbi:MAG: GFA family protein [Rhodospirillales bacterium]